MTEHTADTPPHDTPPRDAPPPPPGGEPPPQASSLDRFFAGLRGVDVRRTDDGWIGGVCAGLAHRLGLDPVVIRAGAVVLAIFFGLGLGLYLLAWLLIPDTREQTMVERGMRAGEAGPIVLLVATAVVLLGSLPWWGLMTFDEPGSTIVSLVVIGALGWGLWAAWQRRSAPGAVSQAGYAGQAAVGSGPGYAAPPPPPQGFSSPAASAAAHPGGSTPPPGPPPPGAPPQAWGPPPAAPPPPTPPRLRRRSPGAVGGLIVSGLLLIVVGGLVWAGDALGLAGNDVAVALAAGLALLGVVLVVLGSLGRRAGFVAFLTWVTLVATVVTAPLASDLSWGDRARTVTWSPASVAELRDYDLGAGQAELTLQNLDPTELTGQRVEVDLGAGQLRIVVPPGMDVTVDSDVGIGDITLVRRGQGSTDVAGGLGVSEQTVLGDLPSSLEIDASVGAGQITIVQE